MNLLYNWHHTRNFSSLSSNSGKHPDDYILDCPDPPLFSSFFVFRDFFYAVLCAESENGLKNFIRSTFGTLWGVLCGQFFQNLNKFVYSAHNCWVRIFTLVLYERAIQSAHLKNFFSNWPSISWDINDYSVHFLLRLSDFWCYVATWSSYDTETDLVRGKLMLERSNCNWEALIYQ